MALEVRLSAEAARQVESIGDYIAQDSPQNAARWVAGLRERVVSLGDSPTRHAVLYTAERAGREVRQALYGVYRILYEIRADEVFVLTVRHGARRPIGPAEIEGVE